MTLLLVGLTTLVSAQNDGWQYTFPYNPDGNNDGYISLEVTLNYLRHMAHTELTEKDMPQLQGPSSQRFTE